MFIWTLIETNISLKMSEQLIIYLHLSCIGIQRPTWFVDNEVDSNIQTFNDVRYKDISVCRKKGGGTNDIVSFGGAKTYMNLTLENVMITFN